MKNKFLFFAAALFAFTLVSCDGKKTVGDGDDGGNGNGNGTSGKLIKTMKTVETGDETNPVVMEFAYDDQKRISKINYDLYADNEEDGVTENKSVREKMAAEMAFTYASDKITVVNTVGGTVYNTTIMTIGSNGLISKVDSPYEDDGNIVFEYNGKKISKSTYNGIMEIYEGGDECIEKPYTEVYVPEWSGNNISKITLTETVEGEKPYVTVDEFKYSDVANRSNIDVNGMLQGSDGMAGIFGNPGMIVNKIGDRTEKLLASVTSTYFYTYSETGKEDEMRSYVGMECTYAYVTDKDGDVTKVTYTEKYFNTDGSFQDEYSGTIEITYVD